MHHNRGDFNARIASGRGVEDYVSEGLRKSEDNKINGEGKELLQWLQNNGVYITKGNVRGENI